MPTLNLNDTFISLIRTYVPIVVASVIAYFATVDIEIQNETLETVLMPLAIGGYYGVARILIKVHPVFGWLLGYPKNPQYQPPAEAAVDEPQAA